MEEIKHNKKPLIALVSIAIIGIIGGAFAYFTNTAIIPNVFNTGDYSTEVEEIFESPQNWGPGDTTPKVITAKNTGSGDVAVRFSYEEQWEDKNGDILSLTDSDNQPIAIINFANNSDFIEDEDEQTGKTYYYYKYKLSSGSTTSSFIESVTFNDEANITTCEEGYNTDNNYLYDGCTNLNSYQGGKYTLLVNVETVQYNAYQQAWNTSVSIN